MEGFTIIVDIPFNMYVFQKEATQKNFASKIYKFFFFLLQQLLNFIYGHFLFFIKNVSTPETHNNFSPINERTSNKSPHMRLNRATLLFGLNYIFLYFPTLF